jgi:hypothetical protein
VNVEGELEEQIAHIFEQADVLRQHPNTDESKKLALECNRILDSYIPEWTDYQPSAV